jgi:hypothetical protein
MRRLVFLTTTIQNTRTDASRTPITERRILTR